MYQQFEEILSLIASSSSDAAEIKTHELDLFLLRKILDI